MRKIFGFSLNCKNCLFFLSIVNFFFKKKELKKNRGEE